MADSAQLMGAPSAPVMMQGQGQMMGQSSQNQAGSASIHHSAGQRSGYPQSSQQQASHMQAPVQQQQYYSSSQAAAAAAAANAVGMGTGYVDYGGGPSQAHQQPPSRHMKSGSSSHHRQRNAIMHQHRTSAAAISDPMMASGLTEHLASANGPLTGSGSALNQLGASGYNTSAYYQQQRDSNQMLPGGNVDYPYQSHQSRYEAHLMPDHVSRGRSRSHAMGTSYPHHQPASTTVGAYHLDPANRSAIDPLGSGVPYDPASRLNYPGASQDIRYMQDRISSMAGVNDVMGLGSYNPLDDLLTTTGPQPMPASRHAQMSSGLHGQHLQHQHQQQNQAHLMDPMSAANYPQMNAANRDAYVTELRARLMELQNSYATVKRELDVATQKLGSSMHSIKTFWSPELKKERALRKEEATKYALINDQMKLMRVEVQVSREF